MPNEQPLKKQRKNQEGNNNSTNFFNIKKMNKTLGKTPTKLSHQRSGRYQNDGSNHKKSSPSMKEMLKHIPKALEFHEQDHKLIQICFSYIDEGLEKWKIGKLIGRGNSSVREAMNIKKGLRAAVKQVYLNEEDQKEKVKEIRVLQKLQHPNVVRYYENYKVKGQTWIFMQYVEINLRKFYLSYGSPPTKVILAFAKQILQALKYLKQQKVIHKDIKCQNILLDNGVVKLCDFGCSKDFQSTFSLQRYQKNPPVKGAKGSYLWAAPQCHQLAKFSFASDIWSFGCTILQLVSGKLPWNQKNFENELQVVLHIADSDQIPLISEEWDERIKELLNLCLKRNEEERISVEELLLKQSIWK